MTPPYWPSLNRPLILFLGFKSKLEHFLTGLFSFREIIPIKWKRKLVLCLHVPYQTGNDNDNDNNKI